MDTNLTDLPEFAAVEAALAPPPQTIDIFAYCYGDRIALLPRLTSVFTTSGGWVLERRTLSATAMEFRFEIQMAGILEFYGALAGLGLELTRATHNQLTDLCVCRKHMISPIEPSPVLTLRLEIQFMADVTLHSILMTGSAVA